MKKYKTIIFDFDYTLADSSKGVYLCINSALKKLGFNEVSLDESKSTIGLSLDDTLELLTGKQATFTKERFTKLFVEKADEVMASNTVMFSDIKDIIPLMVKKDYNLAIVSTKYRYRIENILRRENLLESFKFIVGGEDVPYHKPNPHGIMLVIDKLGAMPEEVLYIGDSITDEKTAINANVDFCVMLTGVTDKSRFNKSYATKFCDNLSDLYNWLEKN